MNIEMLPVRVAKDCDDWLELITMPVGVLMTVADHGPCRGSGDNSEDVVIMASMRS